VISFVVHAIDQLLRHRCRRGAKQVHQHQRGGAQLCQYDLGPRQGFSALGCTSSAARLPRCQSRNTHTGGWQMPAARGR
jgi:hypothetical protein